MEGIAALLASENGSRYRGVSQLQSHQSRYSVQLRSGGFPFRGFELEWSFVATSLEGLSVTGHEKKGTGGPFLKE